METKLGLDTRRSPAGDLASIDIATAIEEAAGVRIGNT